MSIATLILASVLAQSSPATSQPAAPPLLAGPTAAESTESPTITEMSFDGSMTETVTEPDRGRSSMKSTRPG
jgi:hypothetical protein